MKILYTPTIIGGAYKSFYNYTRQYNCELVPFDFINIEQTLECLDDYKNHNRITATLTLFFLYSFLKHDSVDFMKDDYDVVKDDLSYRVNWERLQETIALVDQLVDKAINEKPDWIFIRLFEDLEFFQIYFSYRIKKESNIKICFGKEKELKPYLKNIILKDEFSDYLFVGHGENFLDSFFNNQLNVNKYDENLIYKHDFLDSFNNNISDLEIVNKKYNFAFHTLCPYKCVFCTQNKGNNLNLNIDHIDNVIEKLIYINNKYDIDDNFCISSLPFYTSEEINYFFETVYRKMNSRIKFNIVHLTTPQYLDNFEILSKFDDSLFYVGIEHFSEKILSLMKKPTTKEMNLKLLLNKKYNNAGFGLIYNFFKEELDDYNEMIRALVIARSYQKDRFFKLNSFQYTIPNESEEYKYGMKLIEPSTFREFYNIEDNIYLKYINSHDHKLDLLKEKNKIARNNNILTQ